MGLSVEFEAELTLIVILFEFAVNEAAVVIVQDIISPLDKELAV
jgi:hypothetical protein